MSRLAAAVQKHCERVVIDPDTLEVADKFA
jgi:hypothetical protein